MLYNDAQKLLADLSNGPLAGREVELLTRGNPEARKNEIDQDYRIRFHIAELVPGRESQSPDVLAEVQALIGEATGEDLTLAIVPVTGTLDSLRLQCVIE